jgi:Nucleotidyl transferase of unknown function (DUF2204)
MAKTANTPAGDLPVTSSVPLKIPVKQENLFREVLQVFAKERVPYAVSGAFALRQHTGISRFTKDLDVFLSPDYVSIALVFLEERGFQCEIADPVWLAKVHRGTYFVDLIAGMSNGEITVDDSWMQRAHPARIVDVDTRVIAPEELIASKLFVTRRERFDGADIAHIIYALEGRLDWDRILELAGEHWELVLWNLVLFRYVYPAQCRYVPRELWQNLLLRFASELRSPHPPSRFRGSLIDPRMFAIDVEEWGLEDRLKESQRRSRKIRVLPGLTRTVQVKPAGSRAGGEEE